MKLLIFSLLTVLLPIQLYGMKPNIVEEKLEAQKVDEGKVYENQTEPETGGGAIGHSRQGNFHTTNKETGSDHFNITDEQRIESEEYVHQGLSNRVFVEECKKIDKDMLACAGDGPTKFMGMDSDVVKAVSRAYSIVVGSLGALGQQMGGTPPRGGGGGGGGEGGGEGGGGSGGPPEKEGPQVDWCAIVAAATEAYGMTVEQAALARIKNKIRDKKETQQYQMVIDAARSHKETSKNHGFQKYGWGTVTGCYAVQMARGKAKPDLQTIAKLGGSALLTAFNASEEKANKKYADALFTMAYKLPKHGDCNPFTDPECYCNQPETENDPEHCTEYQARKRLEELNNSAVCIDDKVQADPACECLKTESCLDKTFFSDIAGTNFAKVFELSPEADTFKRLVRGQLSPGELKGLSLGQNARNQRLLAEAAAKIPKKNHYLNKRQQALTDDLSSFGIPRVIAENLATLKDSPQARANAKRFQASVAPRLLTNKKAFKSKILTFEPKSGSRGAKKGKKYKNPYNKYLRGKNKKKRRRSTGSVLTFKDGKAGHKRALRQAQINRDSSRHIFEIISSRYYKSGFRRLDIKSF